MVDSWNFYKRITQKSPDTLKYLLRFLATIAVRDDKVNKSSWKKSFVKYKIKLEIKAPSRLSPGSSIIIIIISNMTAGQYVWDWRNGHICPVLGENRIKSLYYYVCTVRVRAYHD